MMDILKSDSTGELQVEILGIMGNLCIPQFDFAKLAQAHDLLSFIERILAKSVKTAIKRSQNQVGELLSEDDDVLLECIIVLATMSIDQNIPCMLANRQIFQLLIEVMQSKQV
jgi:hypothetical protein